MQAAPFLYAEALRSSCFFERRFMRLVLITALLLATLPGCAARPSHAPRSPDAATTILAASAPANGSTVIAPVDMLVLNFAVPSRLLEVTIDGPDGVSPMMITAAGESKIYSVPLPGLGNGAYRAMWKASSAGQISSGTIMFTVR